MKHKIFVYGILRDGTGEPARISGEMYSVAGRFPAVNRVDDPNAGEVLGEVLTVDNKTLRRFDEIEGHPRFYLRRACAVEYADGRKDFTWVYEWRGDVDKLVPVPGGDWKIFLEELKEKDRVL